YRRTLELLETHAFLRYDVDAVLIKAELNWPALPRDYTWSRHLTRPLTIRIARGHHITMWWPQYVQHLVDLVEDILAVPTRPDSSAEQVTSSKIRLVHDDEGTGDQAKN